MRRANTEGASASGYSTTWPSQEVVDPNPSVAEYVSDFDRFTQEANRRREREEAEPMIDYARYLRANEEPSEYTTTTETTSTQVNPDFMEDDLDEYPEDEEQRNLEELRELGSRMMRDRGLRPLKETAKGRSLTLTDIFIYYAGFGGTEEDLEKHNKRLENDADYFNKQCFILKSIIEKEDE